MRATRTIATALCALALASCGAADRNAQTGEGFARVATEESAPAQAPAPAAGEAASDGRDQAVAQSAVDDAGAPAPVAYLAYTHFIALELPADRIAGVMETHVAACTSAGLRRCQIIRTSRSGDQTSQVGGEIVLRGEPAWLRAFMARIPGDAENADGRIRDENTSSEDLTRAIVDTEARLRAKSALRDRLQRLLENRPGSLADLLAVERELASVQGDIDSIQSTLAVMRTRVAMSTLTLTYMSAPRAVSGDTMQPLNEAFANFFGLTIRGFAAIVTFVGAILPIAIVGGLIAWLLLAIRKRRGGRLFNAPAVLRKEPPPPPPAS
jgi:hypothetical protein